MKVKGEKSEDFVRRWRESDLAAEHHVIKFESLEHHVVVSLSDSFSAVSTSVYVLNEPLLIDLPFWEEVFGAFTLKRRFAQQLSEQLTTKT